ncbi:MAG TPA: hypothetical protein DCG63_12135 [Methylophilaceae bacterium]|nr:hypothetical protein [Methylophilaceae bacterium]
MAYTHIITNATTGEISEVPYTQAEVDAVEAQIAQAQQNIVSVSMRQARLALFQSGYLTQVNAIIAAFPEPQRTAAQIEWEFAADVVKTSPLVAALKSALGLTDQQLTDLFVLASTL